METAFGRLFACTILSVSLHVTCAAAETFDFTCGTIEFTVDFEKSTVSDTIDGTASVDWQYDGDWVRWNVKDTDEFYGVNVKTGDLILDGVVNEAGCRMGDTRALASLPLSEGAYLRRAFIALPEQKRMEIQSVLSQNGYYSSDIDGKWGRGTEAAIKTYVAENQDEVPSADYTSSEGATNTLLGALSHMGLVEDCEGCQFFEADQATGETADALVLDSSMSLDALEEFSSTLFPVWVTESWGYRDLDRNTRLVLRFRSTDTDIIWDSLVVSESNASSTDTEQITESIRRALARSVRNIQGWGFFASYRVYQITYQDQEGLTIEVLAAQSDLDRIEEAQQAKLAAEAKAAEALRQTKLAEEKRKRDAEVAARQKAVEALAIERAAATPSKLEELKQKCSSGVTVSGLCWALSHDEMRLVLIGRGYTCGDGSGGGFTNMAVGLASLFYGMAGEKMSVCEKSDAWVMIEPESLTFSCEVFNTCSYNVRDLGRLLIDEGFVGSLEPSVQVVEGVALTSYCGRGNDGTEICAVNRYDMVGQERNVVTLLKGTAGTGAPSFD